jgi:hypothetical protein
VDVAKANYSLTIVKKFKRWIVHQQFACLRRCFDAFNADGGAVIRVNGVPIHFARATIIALYGDHPACVKSTVTGSGCPNCFVSWDEFGDMDSICRPRTEDAMRVKKMSILARISARVPGDVQRARKEASKEGINLDIRNGWLSSPDVPSCFGPDPNLDNVWLNSPSVMLHAMDEGFVEKFCAATVKWAIHDAFNQTPSITKATVTRWIDDAFAKTYNERPLNSNVEVNGRDCFQLFPHGVVGYLLDKRRLNAKWYGPLVDQLQFCLMGSTFLTPAHKTQMSDLSHMIRQIHYMVRQPIERVHGIEQYQEYLDRFIRKLIA